MLTVNPTICSQKKNCSSFPHPPCARLDNTEWPAGSAHGPELCDPISGNNGNIFERRVTLHFGETITDGSELCGGVQEGMGDDGFIMDLLRGADVVRANRGVQQL